MFETGSGMAVDDLTAPSAKSQDPADWGPVELLRRVEANAAELRAREAEVLVLAAAWADLNDVLGEDIEFDLPYRPLAQRRRQIGGEGTPEVAEYCAAELAAVQGLGFGTGQALIADALDLRHRLPRLWAQVKAGEVRAWKAQWVAQATRSLGREACADVDHAISGLVEALGWRRFRAVVVAACLAADPELAAERAARAAASRDVQATESEDGLRLVLARLDAGDATVFLATVNRLAAILKDRDLAERGATDPVGVRRARAVALLARPADAVALLVAGTAQPPGPGETEADPHHDDPTEDPDPGGSDLGVTPDAVAADYRTRRAREREPVNDPHVPVPDDQTVDGWWDGLEPDDEDDLAHPPDPDPALDPGESGDPVDTEEPAVPGAEAPPSDPQVAAARAARRDWGAGLPAGLGPAALVRARPRVVLYFHLAEAAVRDGGGLIRPEHGTPLTVTQLTDWLTATGCPVQVRPVSVPAETEPVDGYEIPWRVREAVRLREATDVWPFGSCTAATMDLDHSTAYLPPDRGGPPGQTGPATLGPLPRRPHNHKTHGGWDCRQPTPGVYVWRSPHGWTWIVTNHGTMPLGNTPYGHAIWAAAGPDG